MIKKITFLFLVSSFGSYALASDDSSSSDDPKVTYKAKTEIDFDDLEIEGTLQKPQSALVLERKKANFNPLIQLRTDWNQEMDQSADEIK